MRETLHSTGRRMAWKGYLSPHSIIAAAQGGIEKAGCASANDSGWASGMYALLDTVSSGGLRSISSEKKVIGG